MYKWTSAYRPWLPYKASTVHPVSDSTAVRHFGGHHVLCPGRAEAKRSRDDLICLTHESGFACARLMRRAPVLADL